MSEFRDASGLASNVVRPGAILRAMQNNGRMPLPSLDASEAPAPAAAKSAPTPAAPHAAREPSIEVVRKDGRVQKIIAVCGCGDRVVIHCDYDPPATDQGSGGTP
jgi:hypothetical protein